MKIVIIFASLSLNWLLCQQLLADTLSQLESSNSLVNTEKQQPLVSDWAKLSFNQPAKNRTQTRVNLNYLSGQTRSIANHGEISIGVIGCKLDCLTGKIVVIYPQSDLANLGIHAGDSFLAISGQPMV